MRILNDRIYRWARDRGIFSKGTIEGQAIKTLEEVKELIDAIDAKDEAAMKDAIGDIYVTIFIQAVMNRWSIDECVKHAVEQIEGRTGKMEDGVFVKDAH